MRKTGAGFWCSLALFLTTTSAAVAGPVASVADWADRFQAATAGQDFPQMKALLVDAADPRFDPGSLLNEVSAHLSDRKVAYVEQFSNQDLGTFFKRVNFAVMYDHAALFYSVDFAREADGWQILGFEADGNVNHILARQWPP